MTDEHDVNRYPPRINRVAIAIMLAIFLLGFALLTAPLWWP